jgi:hypothetical protein
LEQEKNKTNKRLSITEVLLEKSKKEIHELKADAQDLKLELNNSSKRLSEFYNSNNGENTIENFFLDDEPVVKPSPRTTLTKINRKDLAQVVEVTNKTVDHCEKNKQDNGVNIIIEAPLIDSSDEDHTTPLSNFMNKADNEKQNNNYDLRLTNLDIVKSMHINDFQTITEKDTHKKVKFSCEIGSSCTSKILSRNFVSAKSIYYIQDNIGYKEFFSLTYQSLKLNCEDVEPFLYVYIYNSAKRGKTLLNICRTEYSLS